MAQIADGTGGESAPSTVVDWDSFIEERKYNLPQYGTPSVPNPPTQESMTPTEQSAANRGQLPAQIAPYQDPIITQGSAYMDFFGVPYNPYVGPTGPWDESGDAQAIAQQRYLEGPEITTVAGEASQYTGREFYQGGSEQAYLGPIWQAQAAFNLLTPEEVGFLGVSNALPSHLNPAQERVLLNNGVPPNVLEELYDYDSDTGFWFRTSYGDLGDVSDAGGYDSYNPYNYGYGGYSYPSYGGSGSGGGGLINWRIGI